MRTLLVCLLLCASLASLAQAQVCDYATLMREGDAYYRQQK
ncbi:MAG: hypothetical protein SF053_18285 [Bacteroidia bacterium]|nr:hypothetical protein [Bacteroidia bacterium]